jgi:capsular polysaccharide biosynthesis protein
MNQEFRLSSLFTASFFRWLAIGVITTGVLTFFITSPVLVKPMYRSEAIIYVPLTLFTQQFDQHGIGFGSNVEIDGHIQILRSAQLLDSLIKQFDLTKQWNIDASDEGSRSRLYQKISSRVEITKTRYSSVSVSVRDYDPERAAAMANAIVRLGDVIKEDILLENRLNAYRFARELFEQKQSEILAIEERFGKLTDERNSQAPGAESFRQRTLYEAELWELTARKSDYEKLRESLGTPLPRSYIVSSAVANYTPAWPARLPIITGVILLYIVVALFIQILRKDVQNR